MTQLNQVIIEFLLVMRDDLKRRSYDEEGEQRDETIGRMKALDDLIRDLKDNKT